MREPDKEVKEVKCSETGKAMPKIPQWMADVKVKFVCEEVRQRHTSAAGLPPLPERPALTPIAVIPEVAMPGEDEDEVDEIAETEVAAELATHDDEEAADSDLDADIGHVAGVADDAAGDQP